MGINIPTSLTKNKILKSKSRLYLAICMLEKDVNGNEREATAIALPKPSFPE